ncbi:MAG: hypothetical protein ACI4XM_00395, partial [Candidatus Coprovivens sp.]
ARFGMSKTNKEFVSVTFTLSIEGNQIKVESFSMRHKKDGSELSSYQGLTTLINDSKCLHKTIKPLGEDEAIVVEDDTIVTDINDADALDCGNYNGFRYTRFVENSYMSAEGLKTNIRIETAYPRRVDEDKREYKPQADWEICGIVKTQPVAIPSIDEDEKEVMQFVVEVPTYTEAYGDREASVVLNELTIVSHDESVWGYLEDNFTVGTPVYLNGTIVRQVNRVEIEQSNDDVKGFGRVIEHQPQFRTKVIDYLEVLGGYTIEDEMEEMEEKEFNAELWQKAKVEKDLKLAEMQNGNNEPKKVGFGKPTVKQEPKKVRNDNLPF